MGSDLPSGHPRRIGFLLADDDDGQRADVQLPDFFNIRLQRRHLSPHPDEHRHELSSCESLKKLGAAFVQAHDAYGAIAPSGQVIDVEFPNVEGATNDKDGSHSGISAPEAEAPLIIISSLLILQFIL
jgi:hypothetical protein